MKKQPKLAYQRDKEVWQAAQPPHPHNPDNPLAGRVWGVYQGSRDKIWDPYQASSGEQRELLGYIARRPRATWLGDWSGAPGEMGGVIDEFIAQTVGDDELALVQFSTFRMEPWEHAICGGRAPEQDGYRQWMSNAAAAIGAQHTAVILQPDMPFWWCSNREVTSSLIRHAVSVFEAQPNTSVYIDAGDADWSSSPQVGAPSPRQAAEMLLANGIEEARGFALGATHYASTEDKIAHGVEIVRILAESGVPGKHFVIDTAQNGNGMTWPEVDNVDSPVKDNARICQSRSDRAGCATLGIPPTSRVGDPRWGLPKPLQEQAKKHVDAYLWFSRSWLYMQRDWVGPERGMDMARSTDWPGPPG